MVTGIIIAAVIIVIIIFSAKKQEISRVEKQGGMKVKYRDFIYSLVDDSERIIILTEQGNKIKFQIMMNSKHPEIRITHLAKVAQLELWVDGEVSFDGYRNKPVVFHYPHGGDIMLKAYQLRTHHLEKYWKEKYWE